MSAACVELVEFGLVALVCSSYALKAQARVVFWCYFLVLLGTTELERWHDCALDVMVKYFGSSFPLDPFIPASRKISRVFLLSVWTNRNSKS